MTTNLASAASNVLARANALSQTSSTTGWPEWADNAVQVDVGKEYFDATDAARRLAPAQRNGLASLIAMAETRMAGPNDDARDHLKTALLVIAMRVQPGMAEDAADGWAGSLVNSLSASPMDLLAKAIEAARLKQFQFINEVGPFLEAHMSEPLRLRTIKLNRLREIEVAANRPKALDAPRVEISDAEHAEHMLRINTPRNEASYQRGITEADRKLLREDRPLVDYKASAAKNLAGTNARRGAAGLPPLSMEQMKAEQAAEMSAWIARSRGSRVDEGHLVTPKRTKATV